MEGDLSGGRSRGWLAGLLVAGLVAVSILGRILLGRDIPTPWIAPDEMIYGIVGRTLYSSGRLAIENAHSDFYSLVYPALIGGPLAWLSPHRGYEVAKALGAISMSLAAVPAYLWARSVVSTRSAVLVAALTLALPAFAYSGLLMTETVFYPLLVLVCWVSALTIVSPTWRNQLLLVGLVAAAVLTRLQAGVQRCSPGSGSAKRRGASRSHSSASRGSSPPGSSGGSQRVAARSAPTPTRRRVTTT